MFSKKNTLAFTDVIVDKMNLHDAKMRRQKSFTVHKYSSFRLTVEQTDGLWVKSLLHPSNLGVKAAAVPVC